MHFLLLPFLVLFSLIHLADSVPVPHTTALSTYPQLKNSDAARRYYHQPESRNISLSLGGKTPRPDFDAYIAQLTPIDRPTPVAGYVEVVTISDREYFIFQHAPRKFTDWYSWTDACRVMPDAVEQVTLIGPDQRLMGSPIGVDRWRYEYDAESRIRRGTAWWTAPPEEANRTFSARFGNDIWISSPERRLLYPPAHPWIPPVSRLASEDLYEYWPATGNLRTITSHSHWGNLRTYIRHFDESGNELKEPQ